MWQVNVFIFLLIATFGSCRNIPDFQDESKDFLVSQDDNDGTLNSKDLEKESSENTCSSDKNGGCKNEETKNHVPPQLPRLTGFINDQERMWKQSPYQVNHYSNAGTLGVNIGNHGGMLYPHVHSNLFAALNPNMPVSHLPPVLTGHMQESTPFFVPNFYPLPRTRFTRNDDEEDLLDQLNHDAIMPNILPTMEIPMARSYYGSQVPLTASPAIALYPANVGGCSIPILLSCSPNISRGVLAAHNYRQPKGEKKYRTKRNDEKIERLSKDKSSEPEVLSLPENFEQ